MERGKEHGIEGTDLNFEFKMASSENVVSIDRRIMDVAFLISLTHKKFLLSPPPPHSCLFLVLWFAFLRRLIALTFAGNTCLMNFSVVYVLDFQSLINRLCAKFHIAIFVSIMLFVLPFRTEHSTYFILGKVCHFVGGLKHKFIIIIHKSILIFDVINNAVLVGIT